MSSLAHNAKGVCVDWVPMQFVAGICWFAGQWPKWWLHFLCNKSVLMWLVVCVRLFSFTSEVCEGRKYSTLACILRFVRRVQASATSGASGADGDASAHEHARTPKSVHGNQQHCHQAAVYPRAPSRDSAFRVFFRTMLRRSNMHTEARRRRGGHWTIQLVHD